MVYRRSRGQLGKGRSENESLANRLTNDVADELAKDRAEGIVAAPGIVEEHGPAEGAEADREATHLESAPLPWHIKLLGGAFAVYVFLRLIQMGGWLIRWLTDR